MIFVACFMDTTAVARDRQLSFPKKIGEQKNLIFGNTIVEISVVFFFLFLKRSVSFCFCVIETRILFDRPVTC